jgi:dihydropyrimidinase
MSTLITNGTLITALGEQEADVLIEGEKIKEIGINLEAGEAEIINASGMLVMPGGIDMHTHLDLPFFGTFCSDDFFTGQKAAAFGGTTSHIDFVIQPIGGTLHEGLEEWRKKAGGKTVIDYGFHMAVTDLRPDVMEEIPSMIEEGITSLKLFLAYKDVFMVNDETFFNALLTAREHGMLIMVHAENGAVVDALIKKTVAEGKAEPMYHADAHPALAESESTGRAVALAGIAEAPLYVVHMTCREALEQLDLGRKRGLKVMGETCPQYLFLTVDDLAKPNFEGAKYVCSPPVRQVEDQDALWDALAGDLLQVVSTDHAPFFFEGGVEGRLPGKEIGKNSFAEIPNGMPGIEDRLMVLWHHGVNSGRFSRSRFVELVSTNPAKIFGLYPQKGEILVGSDADILIWDPDQEHILSAATHHMNTDYNVYEGMKVKGKPAKVYLRGKLIVDGDRWLQGQGDGNYIYRKPHAEIL